MKSYHLSVPKFGPIFRWCSKAQWNIYVSTFSKRKRQSNTIWGVIIRGQLGVIIWAKFGATNKKANLAQAITSRICWFNFFSKACAEPPKCIAFSGKTHITKTNLAQIITLKLAKLGPDKNSTGKIHYTCIYMVKASFSAYLLGKFLL